MNVGWEIALIPMSAQLTRRATNTHVSPPATPTSAVCAVKTPNATSRTTSPSAPVLKATLVILSHSVASVAATASIDTASIDTSSVALRSKQRKDVHVELKGVTEAVSRSSA